MPTPEEFEVFELAGLADPDCPPDRVPVRKLFGFTTNDDKGSEERSEREDFLRSEQALSTFPNPAGGTLNIVVPAKSQHLQLYSFTGQILYQADIQGQTAYKLDTNDLIQGQYFVRIVDENGKVFGSSFIKM